MQRIVTGILAHVDAGKTTLSEGLLYLCGNIRKLGRVDHKDAFLDTNALERERGITIFSKQAILERGEKQITLLDTPGHVDFSSEMERTLQVLDYAILVISGPDGVQGHTRTLWKLLERYEIPTFIFVNKMDQAGAVKEQVLAGIKRKLSSQIIDMSTDKEELLEEMAMTDETAMERYLEEGDIPDAWIPGLIRKRKMFPCYFGSALKLEGVKEFLDAFVNLTEGITEDEENVFGDQNEVFGAKVFKITRDDQGNRLTHVKVTSGVLKVKETLTGTTKKGENWEEKVNQIRLYSGEKYGLSDKAKKGMVCALTGLSGTYPGEGLGAEADSYEPTLEAVLNYQVIPPAEVDAHTMLSYLQILGEEDPALSVDWNEELEEIHVKLMGEVQTEVLKCLVEERFHVNITFGPGNIVYKETIENTVEGVGHFEPLRHYAEVHLLLEPGERGSGLTFASACSEDILDKNWQRLILTHLQEKEHRGVLTGSAITDMKITLLAGKAHLKHTEGGDFRQSTYRAVRQGLMQAKCRLLEPYYTFRLEVPADVVGRAMTDITRMKGEFTGPEIDGEMNVFTGTAPVSLMWEYTLSVTGYTRGEGSLSLVFSGYGPCHNEEEIITATGYDPEADLNNPTGSVFCAHGAGYYVPWDDVFSHMHIESQIKKKERIRPDKGKAIIKTPSYNAKEEKELEEIFIRTYGKVEHKTVQQKTVCAPKLDRAKKKKEETWDEFLLVDGYNVIFAWDELKNLAKENMEGARGKLADILCNYQGFRKCNVILVFDAYQVAGYQMEIQKYHNIHIVYTKQAETADQYIEKVVHTIGRKYHVTVVTSDGLEQVVTLGQGGSLISSREFAEEYEIVRREIKEETGLLKDGKRNYLFDHMDEKLADEMEDIRLGRRAAFDERKEE